MTEQEVIKYLKGGCLGLNCEYHIKDRCKDDFEAREKKKADAIILSIKAIEKQIAKKVLIKHHEKTPWTREISQYLCPCCNRVIGFNGQIHCSTCGQKLLYDWGNEYDRD